jgi:hypothetical protein
VYESDLDLPVAHLLERVVHLVGQVDHHLPEPGRLLQRTARDPARP